MRAYSSLRQLEEKGIYVDEYLTNEREGVFKARLDCKRWGKKRNVLTYFTFEDGSKIMAAAWQNTGYLGIPEIEEGAVLTLTFEKAKNGISYLRKVERNEGKYGKYCEREAGGSTASGGAFDFVRKVSCAGNL